MSDDLEFKIARLELRPGDVMVVKINARVTDGVRRRVEAQVGYASKWGGPIMVIDQSIDLAILTAAEIAERSAAPTSDAA